MKLQPRPFCGSTHNKTRRLSENAGPADWISTSIAMTATRAVRSGQTHLRRCALERPGFRHQFKTRYLRASSSTLLAILGAAPVSTAEALRRANLPRGVVSVGSTPTR
jgi:hypothetical protein